MAKNVEENANRVSKIYPSSDTTVDKVDLINTYRKSFNSNYSAVSLDIDVRDEAIPCTISPPEVDSYCSTKWTGEYVSPSPCSASECCGGTLVGYYCTEMDATTGNYTYTTDGIVVPYDGCYLVHYKGAGHGLSYFTDASGGAYITHNGINVIGYSMQNTGFIATLGPWIYYWAPVSNLYYVVEARAGDTIGCLKYASDFAKCRGWYGTYLRGYYSPNVDHLTIRLLAIAENVKAVPREEPLEYEEGTVVDPDAARVTMLRPSSAMAVII